MLGKIATLLSVKLTEPSAVTAAEHSIIGASRAVEDPSRRRLIAFHVLKFGRRLHEATPLALGAVVMLRRCYDTFVQPNQRALGDDLRRVAQAGDGAEVVVALRNRVLQALRTLKTCKHSFRCEKQN